MGSNYFYRRWEIPTSKKDTMTGGRTITRRLLFFVFVSMGQFQSPFLTSPDAFMTVRWQRWVRFIGSWGKSMRKQAPNAACCVNSAFGNVDREYLYKSCQDLLESLAPTQAERKMELRKRREATSARQTAEWGMLTMQASFPRVRDWFVYKERGERRIVFKMFVLLYNMRARMVGINQIRNTYMQHLLHDANKDVCF